MNIGPINRNISFKGAPEILYNLGKAINSAQHAENSGNALTLAEKLGSRGGTHAYIDAATQDEFFPEFINNFESYLDSDTKSSPEGMNGKPATLKNIAEYTDNFEKADETKKDGFKFFKFYLLGEVHDKMKERKMKECDMSELFRFLDAIRPE